MSLTTDLQNALAPDLLAGLADDDLDGAADPAVLLAALEASAREVRQRTGGAVALAGDELPPLLNDFVVTFAVERLYERRRETPPRDWSARADRARKLLAEIAAGTRPVEGAPRRASVATNVEPDSRQTRPGALRSL